MLRTLSLVAVRQEQRQPGHAAPFGLAGTDELIDDDLRAIGEVTELELDPQSGQVRVHIKVDRKFLPRKSEEATLTKGLLSGDAAIDFLNFVTPNGNGWGYCVFGRVIEGTEVVDKIEGVQTGSKDVPVEDVIILKAEVL